MSITLNDVRKIEQKQQSAREDAHRLLAMELVRWQQKFHPDAKRKTADQLIIAALKLDDDTLRSAVAAAKQYERIDASIPGIDQALSDAGEKINAAHAALQSYREESRLRLAGLDIVLGEIFPPP